MDRTWIFDQHAVTLTRIDFLDPALAGEPDVRERGVRLEVRPVSGSRDGSIYASATTTLAPAVFRIDLLESRPHAADRMHWHPTMPEGEPGERVFDPALSADPLGWLADRLRQVEEVAPAVDDIVAEAGRGLAWAREPWPSVEHDERGLAVS